MHNALALVHPVSTPGTPVVHPLYTAYCWPQAGAECDGLRKGGGNTGWEGGGLPKQASRNVSTNWTVRDAPGGRRGWLRGRCYFIGQRLAGVCCAVTDATSDWHFWPELSLRCGEGGARLRVPGNHADADLAGSAGRFWGCDPSAEALRTMRPTWQP